MPVYDYKCQEHGIYNELATLDDSAKPTPCPECGILCARIIMVPPSLQKVSEAERKGHETNEKSQHEPIFSNEDRRQHDHQHAAHSGCNKHKVSSAAKMLYTATGEKIFPSARPWMIGH